MEQDLTRAPEERKVATHPDTCACWQCLRNYHEAVSVSHAAFKARSDFDDYHAWAVTLPLPQGAAA